MEQPFIESRHGFSAQVELDSDLAIHAARIGKDEGLALTDSIIYATARKHKAMLWTQDRHFKDLDSVRYLEKK